jgi:hypothetical protein
MRIEQITTSRMIADEGKVFVRKSDGYVMGEVITLGYDYYDAGLPLKEGHATNPDDYEETTPPENWHQPQLIRPVQTLKRATEICNQYTAEMNDMNLSATEALEVQSWYPKLYETDGFKEGDTLAMNTKFQYDGKLWAARQTVVVSSVYPPSIDTAALYVEVTEDYVDGVEQGTLENPIEYSGNMVLEEGKYYAQDGVTYLCTRDTGNPVYHALKDLVGLYVEVA